MTREAILIRLGGGGSPAISLSDAFWSPSRCATRGLQPDWLPKRPRAFYQWSGGQVFGLLSGLGGGQVFGQVFGLSSRQLTERLTLSPNEGIRRSVKNGLLILFFGLVGGLSVGLVVGLLFRLVNALVFGLVFGLGAAVQHYIPRFWLSCTHTFPWKAVPFLEDATKRILLRRVGGGYSFAHRLLLDYFADQRLGSAPAAPPSSIPTRTSHAADDATQ